MMIVIGIYLFKNTVELAIKLFINNNVDAMGTFWSRDDFDGAI